MSGDYRRHAFAPGSTVAALCCAPAAVHISTGPPDCPACLAVLAAAHVATGELQLLVVLDMADDDRTPGEVARDVRYALETGHERVIHVEDLPAGVRILAPGERNGRA